MTDFEKVKWLLTELGISYDIHTFENGSFYVELAEGTEKVEGLSGHVIDFNFTQDGLFNEVEIWDY